MTKFEDLYTDPHKTKPVYNIKKHIVVDSKVVYNTNKPPYETTVLFYVMAAFILLCALKDFISILFAIRDWIDDTFYDDFE